MPISEKDRKINQEFSDLFDILYNNITSNQAPGIDEYEKSVFLTRALNEIILNYFNPIRNKTLAGFDSNERRQIDFSMLMRAYEYSPFEANKAVGTTPLQGIDSFDKLKAYAKRNGLTSTMASTSASFAKIDGSGEKYVVSPFLEPSFDLRSNTKAVSVDSEILLFVNEQVYVTRSNKETLLTVVPIEQRDYFRLMSKPFKRPLKFLAWRILNAGLLDSETASKRAEIIVGPNDLITKYIVRYVKRPRAIRLIDFTNDGLTIEGKSEAQACELDPILFDDIILRAAELAKAAYAGDLNSVLAVSAGSQTEIGTAGTRQLQQ